MVLEMNITTEPDDRCRSPGRSYHCAPKKTFKWRAYVNDALADELTLEQAVLT